MGIACYLNNDETQKSFRGVKVFGSKPRAAVLIEKHAAMVEKPQAAAGLRHQSPVRPSNTPGAAYERSFHHLHHSHRHGSCAYEYRFENYVRKDA